MKHVLLLSFLAASFASARAADVAVSVTGGSLIVTGSATTDTVTIDQAGLADPEEFRVTPDASTTVNGSTSPQVFTGVKKDIRYTFPSGTHTASITNSRIARDVRLVGGASGMGTLFVDGSRVNGDVRGTTGGGRVLLRVGASVVEGDCRIVGGDGGDDLTVGPNTEVFGDAILDGGGDGDIELINRSHVRGRVEMRGGEGPDSVSVNESAVDRGVLVRDDLGDDLCELLQSEVAGVNCRMGAGKDRLLLATSQVRGKVAYLAGSGDNELTTDRAVVHGSLRMKAADSIATIHLQNATAIGGDVRIDLGAGVLDLNLNRTTFSGDFRLEHGEGDVAFDSTDCQFLGDVELGMQPATGAGLVTATFDVVNVGDDVALRCGAGADDVDVSGVQCGGTCTVRMGDGNQMLRIGGTRVGRVDVSAGSGVDTVMIVNDVVIRGDASLRLGNGANVVHVTGATCGDDFLLRTGAGDDTLMENGFTIAGTRDVDLGGGNNVGG